MYRLRHRLVIAALSALLLGGCVSLLDIAEGGDTPAGQPCDDGDTCSTGICLKQVPCADGRRVNACADEACEDTCKAGQRCVRLFGLRQSRCFPESACDASDAGPTDLATDD